MTLRDAIDGHGDSNRRRFMTAFWAICFIVAGFFVLIAAFIIRNFDYLEDWYSTHTGITSLISKIIGILSVTVPLIPTLFDILYPNQYRAFIASLKINHLSRARPKSADRMAIYVADILGDDTAKSTREQIIRSIVNGLGRHIIEVLPIGFLLPVDDTESSDRSGERSNEEARALLLRRKADLLIWGSVNKGKMRLHFVVPTGDTSMLPVADHPFECENSALDGLLTTQVGLALAAEIAVRIIPGGERGVTLSQCLLPFLKLIDNHEASAESIGQKLAPADERLLKTRHALLLHVIAARLGDQEMLKLAICKYRDLLREPQGPGPDESRAMLQYSLGAALQTLGESEAATARLNEAVEVYNQAKLTLETPGNPQAAEAQKRTRRTLELAATLNNRASAKKSIADREGNSGLLRQALDDLDQARKELGEQRGPYVQELRAKILVNRGNAQRRLGEMEKNPDCLAVAEEAYEEAIKILIAEQSTLELASTTTCLANVLQTRGRMERSKILLDRAVDAYREVLKVQSSEGTKIDWAVTQNNLADALVELGRMTGSATPLEAALRAYEEALTVRKKKLYPLDWAFTWDGYSNALDALATCTNDRKYREDAIKRLNEAIAVYQQCGVAGDHLMGARERCDTMKKSLESMMAHAVGYS